MMNSLDWSVEYWGGQEDNFDDYAMEPWIGYEIGLRAFVLLHCRYLTFSFYQFLEDIGTVIGTSNQARS